MKKIKGNLTIEGEVKLNNTLLTSNIESGTGTNAIQMKQDVTTIDYTGRNPNATTIDSTITGTIEIGAKGAQSATFGKQTTAMNLNALAEGNKTIAKGEESHAEGYQSVALGDGSHAEGHLTVSSGVCSHSEGNNTIASGEISHAEGYLTKALAEGSHTEGNRTVSNHPYQTIVGMSNDNKEDTLFEVGNGSTDGLTRSNAFQVHLDGHAEVSFVPTDNDNAVPNMGTLIELENTLKQIINEVESTIPTNLSNGNPSQAGTNKNIQGGRDSIADYDGDFVFGTGLRNTMENQAVFGKYNDNSNWNPNRPLLMVGNGESDSSRKNAFEVYLDGHAEVQTMGTTDSSVATKAYVDANAGGGTKLYKHTITCSFGTVVVISTSSTQGLPEGSTLNAFIPSSGATASVQGYIKWNYGGAQVRFVALDNTIGGDIYNPGGAQWTAWNIDPIN